MSYIQKTIYDDTGYSKYGTVLKAMFDIVFANTTTISNVTVNTATSDIYNVSFTYYGARINIYNDGYNVFISIDGSEAIDIVDVDNFVKSYPITVHILESVSCGLALSFQSHSSGSYNELYFSFIPAVAILSDNTEQNMLLVGHSNGAYENNRTWLPTFVPYYNFTTYKLCIPSVTGLYSFTTTETIGSAISSSNGKAIASPILVDSSIAEIKEFKINGFQVYRIYPGTTYLKTSFPGLQKVNVGDSEFVFFSLDALIRLS